ncbi:putative ankyrin repeat-containing domain superfamily [Helianthus annuus]|nr:putative ankyrin repeat-containing domain superfamily [Helianthus annuus]
MVMSSLTVETEDSFSSLLEYAANNDFEGFKLLIQNDPSAIYEVGLWYVRKKGSKQIVLEHWTPLMVAAMYGSVSVLKLIISQPKVDVNSLVARISALHFTVRLLVVLLMLLKLLSCFFPWALIRTLKTQMGINRLTLLSYLQSYPELDLLSKSFS